MKNWIILLPDLHIQLGRGKTVPGNNLSSHDLNPLWARAASHALDPVLHHGDKGFFKCFTSTLSSFFLSLYVIICAWNVLIFMQYLCL